MKTTPPRKERGSQLNSSISCYESMGLDELRTALNHTHATIQSISHLDQAADLEKILSERNIDRQCPGFQRIMKSYQSCDSQLRSLTQGLAWLKDELQTAIHSRVPLTSKTDVLSLSNEILMNIFNLVREASHRSKDIQSLRLTCRRFHDTSSHLLLSKAKVDVSSRASLERLEKISKHPTIRMGIKSVRLHMVYYGLHLANDERLFIQHCTRRLRSAMKEWAADLFRLRDMRRMYDQPTQDPGPLPPIEKAIDQAKQVLEVWQTAVDGSLDRRNSHYVRLRQIHKEYKLKYELQEASRGDMAQTIASAMANMPRARCLIFRDGYYSRHAEFDNHGNLKDPYSIPFTAMEPPDAIYPKLLAPIDGWEDFAAFGLGTPPGDILIAIPLAAHQAGASLSEVKIKMMPPGDLPSFGMTSDDQKKLKAATCNLTKFEFTFFAPVNQLAWSSRETYQYLNLLDYVTCWVSSEEMEHVAFNFEILNDQPWPHPVSLGQVLTAYGWPKLKQCCFDGSFYLEDLKEFIGQYAGNRNLDVDLNGHLIGERTWEETLDFLRGRVSPRSRLFNKEDTVAGAECGDMTERQICYCFGHSSGNFERNRATAYVVGAPDKNPVREVKEGQMGEDWESASDSVPFDHFEPGSHWDF